jgi:hypothetical protein
MDDARSRSAGGVDGRHVAPDHAVRPRNEFRLDLGERGNAHRLLLKIR